MKKLLMLVVSSALLFSACKKEEDPKIIVDGVDVNNPVYAKKTVVETQKDLEKTGIEMVSEFKQLNKEPGMVATVNLVDLASSMGSNDNGDDSWDDSYAFRTLKALASVNKGKGNVQTLTAALEDSDDLSVKDQFKENAGTYTYNFEIEDMDFEAAPNSGKIIIKFPASKASLEDQTLDGELVVNEPTFVSGPFIINDETIKELPTSAGYELKVDNQVVTNFSFTASYNADGLPIDVVSSISMGPFVMEVKWGYKTSEVSASYSFKNGTKSIFALGAAANGKFSKADIDNMSEEVIEKRVYGDYTYTDTFTRTYPERVLHNANAYFQFMDIKIAGSIDFKGMMEVARKQEAKVIPDNETEAQYEKRHNEELAEDIDAINKYVKLVVVYASNNEAIAKAEAIVTDVEYEEFDWATGKEVVKTKKGVGFHMIMDDGKKIDFETYFNDGFDELFTSFNGFIDELNTTYEWKLEGYKKEIKP